MGKRYDYIWTESLSKHLPLEFEIDVVSLYRNCYDYSPYPEYNSIVAFVTKCFIERNRQLDQKRYIVQVKMKWGYLTIYYDGGKDPYLDEMILTATKMADQLKSKLEDQYRKGGWRHRTILPPSEN